jgi:uncharacterized protein YndB with AHSA1/START domain
MTREQSLTLVVRRRIRASAARLFESWTTPAQMRQWWGPAGVHCTDVLIDLRVGGRYRIVNALPDGRSIAIEGEFLAIEPPHRLAYTWSIEAVTAVAERVTVRFDPDGEWTEVVVVHERIADPRTRDEHASGWHGCLDGLGRFIDSAAAAR